MTQSGHCDRKPGQCVFSANPRSTANLARASPLGLIFLALQKATNVSGSSITGFRMMPSRFAFATRLFASSSHSSKLGGTARNEEHGRSTRLVNDPGAD